MLSFYVSYHIKVKNHIQPTVHTSVPVPVDTKLAPIDSVLGYDEQVHLQMLPCFLLYIISLCVVSAPIIMRG